MKKNVFKLAALPLLASLATPVFAGDFYMGASLGQAKSDDFCDVLSDATDGTDFTATSCDDSDSAFKIFAGYSFTQNWAIEGAYADLGEYSTKFSNGTDTGTAKAEIDAWSLALVGTLPVSDHFNLFAKAGLYTSNTDARATLADINVSDDDSNSDGLFGIGASYSFTESFAIRGEWERYLADDADIDLLTAGLVFSF